MLALPRAEGFPLGPEVLDSSHDPHLRGAVGSPLRRSRIPLAVVRYLEVGNRSAREDVHYPDDDMVMKRVAGKAPTFTRADGSPY